MNKDILGLYRRFRGMGCIVGEDARVALANAKTVARFRELENRGVVRIQADPEEENYFDVYGTPEGYYKRGHWVTEEKALEEMVRTLDLDGVWYVHADYCIDGVWNAADGVGMCAGYKDPTDPWQNCYVTDLMSACIDKLEGEWKDDQSGDVG